MSLRLERRSALRDAVSIFGESLVIIASALLIMAWHKADMAPFDFTAQPFLNAIIVAPICQASIYVCGLYDPCLRFGPIEHLIGLAQAFSIAFIVILAALLLEGRSIDFISLLLGFGILLVFTKSWRLIMQKVSGGDLFRQRIILWGTSGHARELYEAAVTDGRAEASYHCSITIAAVADSQASGCSFPLQPQTPFIHAPNGNELIEAASKYNTNKIIVCKPLTDTLTPDLICDLKHKGLCLRSEDAIYEAAYGRRNIDRLDPKELIYSRGFHRSIRRIFKRFGDIIIASMLLLLLSPLFLLIGLKLKFSRSGRVLETRASVGHRKKHFKRYVFAIPQPVSRDRFSFQHIKALPQLWNVLKGDMSLVGPCPIGPQQSEKMCQELPIFDERFTVRPGLTGWAQVNCDCNGSNKTVKHMFGYDLFYLRHMSLFLDIAVLSRAIRYQCTDGLLVGSNS
jgi:lipopolysaccharide/colanic/teichoic acid biosynthesis glycosyltransferase